MSTLFRQASRWISRSTSSWITLVLLFVVLVPSVCLLWFMNQAVQNEQLAVRQKLLDAYRAQLTTEQERLDAGWKKIDDLVEATGSPSSASARFARAIRAGVADAVVIFHPDHSIAYPTPPDSPRAWRADLAWRTAQELEAKDKSAAAEAYGKIGRGASDDHIAARALQAQARCLFQAGAVAEGLVVLNGSLQAARFTQAVDPQNRLVVPNAELLALEFLSTPFADEARTISQRLRARVLNYDDSTLPSGQRRFLLRELQRLAPDSTLAQFLAAEDLAAAYVDTKSPLTTTSGSSLHRSSLPGIWETLSPGGEIVLLHRAEGLSARVKGMISPTSFPADVHLDLLSPGEEKESALLSLSAGPRMPGWRLALSLDDAPFSGAGAPGRVSSYRWIGLLMVFAVLLLALLAWGLVRRQLALTELRNDLVANVTHELKTPLASMRLLVDTLLNNPTWNERTARDYLQLIARENLRLSRLIGNFLTFSRIERNKYSFQFKPVQVQAIVDAAVAAVGDRFQSPGCRFDVVMRPDLPPVVADADAIVTALVNLLDNAWKYSGEAKHIRLNTDVRNEQVYWEVSDNGIGLSPRDTKRVFQRFHQVHPHLSHAGGGCGLGLSIVQFIIEAHRGTVTVASELGQGSTFTLTLPLHGITASDSSTL